MMTTVMSYLQLKKYLKMHKEDYKMNFINLVIDKVTTQNYTIDEDCRGQEDKGVLDEVKGELVIATDRIIEDMRNSCGVDDTVADAVRNLLNYFKPKEEGWFIPKDTLYNKNFSDGITDGKVSIWTRTEGGYIIDSRDIKVQAKDGGYQAQILGKLFSGKVAVANNKKALDIFMGK